MTATLLTSELQRVLWAFHEHWKTLEASPTEREVCFEWIIGPFVERFKVPFEPARLKELAKMGLLARGDAARKRTRRFYCVPDPERLALILKDAKIQ